MNKGKEPEKSRRTASIATLERASTEQIQTHKNSNRRTSAHMKELIYVLEALTDPSIKHLTLDELFFVALKRIREIMAADNLAILLLSEDKQFLVVRAVLGLEEAVADEVHIPLGRGFAGKIAMQRKPLAVQDLSTVEILTPVLREQLTSLLGVPLVIEDSVIGVIHIGMKRKRIFTKTDIMLFERVARCLAQAIERTLREEAAYRAHMAAARRTEQLEAIFEAITDGLIVYDQQGHISKTNAAARRMLGIDTQIEAFYNTSLEERLALYQIQDQFGHPLPLEKTPPIRILHGESLSQHMASDIQLCALDGHKIQLNVTGAPLHDEQEKINGAVCALRDVTEHRNLERRVETLDTLIALVEALMQSSQEEQSDTPESSSTRLTQLMGQHIVALAQRVLNCSQAMMIGMDLHTQMCRPIALIGFSTEQEQRIHGTLSGAHIATILPDPKVIIQLETQGALRFDLTQSPLLQSHTTTLLHTQRFFAPIKIERHLAGLLIFAFPDADYVPTLEDRALIDAISKLSALAIEHEHNTMERNRLMMALKHLNTQLEQINEELEQANKRQGGFISMVGHEFRTALTSIQGFSELLCSEEYSGNEIKDFANDISQEALRLNRMITDLLDLERMKSGRMQLYLQSTDLNSILAEVVERTRITASQHTLRLALDTALSRFEADRDKLTQVIGNMLSNAVKYSPEGGEIVVRSMQEGQKAHVIIEDSGMGMPADMLENIFIPYSRVEIEKTHTIKGTGLGLPIVRQIIEMHGGRVWAESKLGLGSLFHFTLPLLRSDTHMGLINK